MTLVIKSILFGLCVKIFYFFEMCRLCQKNDQNSIFSIIH